MKKIILSTLLGSMLCAGGDLPEVTYVDVESPQASPFYAGIGFGVDDEVESDFNDGYSNVSLFMGAVVAREGTLALAVEARLATTLDDYGVDSWGLYIKPEIDFDGSFQLFGILGYQNLTTYDYTYDATGLGVGGVYMFNDNIGVQLDYIYSFIADDEYGYTPEYANATASLLYRF
jgi:hypothetical protein